jgi:hypothetical protein
MSPDDIVCEPRGVDDIDYVYSGGDSVPDARVLISAAAVFVMFGAIPMIGHIFQGLIIIFVAPYIINIVKGVKFMTPLQRKSLTISDVNVDRDGHVNIQQR